MIEKFCDETHRVADCAAPGECPHWERYIARNFPDFKVEPDPKADRRILRKIRKMQRDGTWQAHLDRQRAVYERCGRQE